MEEEHIIYFNRNATCDNIGKFMALWKLMECEVKEINKCKSIIV